MKEVTAKNTRTRFGDFWVGCDLTFPEARDSPPSRSRRCASRFRPRPNEARLAFEHLQWLSDERKCGAKYGTRSAAGVSSPPRSFCGETRTRRTTRNDRTRTFSSFDNFRKINKDGKTRKTRSRPDVRAKWLSWDQYIDLVRSLEDECARGCTTAGRGADQRRGVESAAISHLRSVVVRADRQRAKSANRDGRTLFKNPRKTPATGKTRAPRGERRLVGRGSGDRERRAHGVDRPEDIRDGGGVRVSVGDSPRAGRLQDGRIEVRPPMVISPKLYGAMEEWIRTRRAHLKPTHDFLFTSKNGGPLTDTAVRLLTSTSYRLTRSKGRTPAPHHRHDHHAPQRHGRERARTRGARHLHGTQRGDAKEGDVRSTNEGGEGGACGGFARAVNAKFAG